MLTDNQLDCTEYSYTICTWNAVGIFSTIIALLHIRMRLVVIKWPENGLAARLPPPTIFVIVAAAEPVPYAAARRGIFARRAGAHDEAVMVSVLPARLCST